MNLSLSWLDASPTTSASAAHAIRQRLMNPPRAKAILQITEVQQTMPEPVEIEPQPVMVPYRPRKVADMPKPLDKSQKDAHVKAYEAWMVGTIGSPCKAHIMERATEYGLTYADVIGSSRMRAISTARQQIMCSLRVKFPSMSLPQIARLFGRDHTTVLHALVKFGCKTAARISVTPDMIEQMRTLEASGENRAEIGRRLGVSVTTVAAYLSPETHKRYLEVRSKRRKDARARERAKG